MGGGGITSNNSNVQTDVARTSTLGIQPGQNFTYAQLTNPSYTGFTPRSMAGNELTSYKAPPLAKSGRYETYTIPQTGRTFDVWIPGPGNDYQNFKSYYPFNKGTWEKDTLTPPPPPPPPPVDYYTRVNNVGATPYYGDVKKLQPKGETPVYDQRSGAIVGYK